MNQLYICLLLFFICGRSNAQTPVTVTKKVIIIRSYNELLQLPSRDPGQGDYINYFISLFPSDPGILRDVVLGDLMKKMSVSKVYSWDIDRNSYLSILTRYNIPRPRVMEASVLPDRFPEPKTYYKLNEKPVTIQMWTADAVCEKYKKKEGGNITDSIFFVKSLNNFLPLDNFVDDSFCSVQRSSMTER